MGTTGFKDGSLDGTSGSTDDEGGSFETAYVTQLQAAFSGLTANQLPSTDHFPNYPSTLEKPEIASVVQAATGGAAIVAGSWAAIYGANPSAASRLWFPSEFNGNKLPVSVDHVTVTINGEPAAMHYVSPGQVNAQARANLPNGPVTVVPSRDGRCAQFQAAAPGEILAFYGSGFAPAPTGALVNSTATPPGTVTVKTGGTNEPTTAVFEIGDGLFQINMTVTYNGVTSPSGVSIPVVAQ